MSKQLPSSKNVPQRTCIACRKVIAKGELVRVVRVADGTVEIDTSGKKAGRGAYLCRARECWQLGLKGNCLEHALRGSLTPGNREQLIRYSESLGKG
ncbi:MAG: YlxR family protein [Chloroflexi bacterium]|nr:YlxR family protein [Chloroflexota bacterium]